MYPVRATLIGILGALSLGAAPIPRVAFLKPLPGVLVFSDAGIGLKVRVEPYPENRLLIVAAVDAGGEVVRRSDEDLPGEGAPRTRVLWWSSLPAGDLLIIAEVHDAQKPLGRASFQQCVVTRGGDLCPRLRAEP